MVKEQYSNIKQGVEIRQNLIELRAQLKVKENLKIYQELTEQENALFSCLKNEDPKVRKNAVLILGETEALGALEPIYEAYEAEQQMFVKTAYLKALEHFDYSVLQEKLEGRLKTLVSMQVEESSKKHIQEEIRQLQKMVTKLNGILSHEFCGYKETLDMLLTTYRPYQNITADQIHSGEVKILNAGVRVISSNLKSILNIRTYREILFLMKGSKKLSGTPENIASKIIDSDLMDILLRCHKQPGPFYFRIDVRAKMTLEERSAFTKKAAAVIEEKSGRNLINSTSDYEVEIRLMESQDGTFFPCFRMMTIPMQRFDYRKEVVSTSIHPSLAAVLMHLAQPYLSEKAQILDPFCGVGTMLVERNRLVRARVNYGIDSFGEAIEKAKINTEAAQLEVNYIHRDFFDFKHGYLFDEIVTNMPVRGRKSREEMDELYARFFEKASEVLAEEGIIIMYSNEGGFIKKQLRLRTEYKLLQEYNIRKKDGYTLYILERR